MTQHVFADLCEHGVAMALPAVCPWCAALLEAESEALARRIASAVKGL